MITKKTIFPHHSLIISLFTALGTYNNIQSITNCMSRLRIIVKDSTLLAEDSIFLQLDAKGVSRNNNSIQLIYGQQSPQLAYQLNLLKTALEDSLVIELFHLCKGTQYISTIDTKESQIIINFKKVLILDTKQLANLSKQYYFTYNNHENHLSIISEKKDTIYSHLQITMIFWYVIQSYFIFDTIKEADIQSISRSNDTLKINTSNPLSITSSLWESYGLLVSINTLDTSELLIQKCFDELYPTLLEYYHFNKNTYTYIDMDSI